MATAEGRRGEPPTVTRDRTRRRVRDAQGVERTVEETVTLDYGREGKSVVLLYAPEPGPANYIDAAGINRVLAGLGLRLAPMDPKARAAALAEDARRLAEREARG